MLQFFQDNQFAVGMLMTTVLAASLAYMRNAPKVIWRFVLSQFSVSAEIKNNDPAFYWVSMWLDSQPYSKKTRQLSVYTYHRDEETNYDFDGDGVATPQNRKKNRPRLLFTPAQGMHLFWYKRHLIWLNRIKGGNGDSENPAVDHKLERESFELRVIGRNQKLIREIMHDAMEMALPEAAPETCIIQSAEGRWQSPIRKKPRARSSVILDGHGIDSLIEDAKKFLKNKSWYDELGIPYRRGYLLHGVPGSGKTSAVLALAGELGLDVYMLNLGDKFMDDGRLNYLLSCVPAGNIVLLEDIDAAFRSRESAEAAAEVTPVQAYLRKKRRVDDSPSTITFSGLLNALDGVAAREGRLLFLTTNYKDDLDPALIRPGRTDMHVEFKYATPAQAMKMFNRFFPKAAGYLAERFGVHTPDNAVSMAGIQDHLLTHKDDPEKALAEWITTYSK